MTKDCKFLEKKDLDKVREPFRSRVVEAWARGENVPYGVQYLSSAELNDDDIAWAHEIVKNTN